VPLFFVHAHGGGSIAYYPLAQRLGRNQPFYGLEAPGLDGQSEPILEIPEMAGHYLKELRRIQPDGPYLLGGHSFGGLVAFEMAQQLSRQGHEVALLAILDTAAPVTGNTPFDTESFLMSSDDPTAFVEMAGLIERVVGKTMGVSQEELSALEPEEQVNYFLQKLKSVDFISPDAGPSLIRGFLGVHRASSRASHSYVSQAQAYSGTMTLFLSSEVAPGDFRAQDRVLRDDPILGWGELVKGTVETRLVPGDHISMLTPPHVQVLADKLAYCIEQVKHPTLERN
jgi:thioesterase domain-containing protein